MTNTEGGTDDEEFRVAAVKDRVDTTLQVWMGLTMGCAKCHNHKYDPITQEQYYQAFALFNQTADADRPDESPTLEAPTPEMIELAARLDPQIAALKKQIADAPLDEAEQRQWESQLADAKAEERKKVPKDVLALLDKPAEERSDADRQKIAQHFRTVAPALKPQRDELAALESRRPKFPQVPIMQELPADKRRATHVLVKGNFLQKGEAVEPGVPAAFHPLPAEAPARPAGPGALAGRSRQPAHGARRRQPLLGAALRQRAGRDRGRLRHAGRAAPATRSCSTGWPSSMSSTRLGHQGAA